MFKIINFNLLLIDFFQFPFDSGVSIGEDGPSQMALEDIAIFRAIPEATVFYPSDAVSTERACELGEIKRQ